MSKTLWMAAGAATALAGNEILKGTKMHDIERMAENLVERFGRMADEMFTTVETQMSGRFDSYSTDALTRSTRYRVDKTKDGVVITIEVPGLTHKDVGITLENGVLHIVARGSQSKGHDFEFNEQFRVNRNIDMSNIGASVKNGLLVVTLKRDDIPASPKGTVPVSPG